ncbi:ribokinase [Oceanobacillus salinisoli]|uniref:ribokinase n=1 Tax=Oceanobacillus salinisoli TaxID=2678611 RepID=UPI0012E0FC92|nr:ribokinase [Oceanobacillus salinisoli]
MSNPTIMVIGSINVDLVTVTDNLPDQGETLLGNQFHINPGGKGANQAVAAARLGANVQMIGKVGQDSNGEDMLKALEKENVSTTMIESVSNVSTGIANIILSNHDNRIIIVPGANNEVTPEYVKQYKEEILKSDLVLLQFEIPLETVMYCLDLCKEYDIPVVLNPAPAREMPEAYWLMATYITPNETEAERLFSEKDSNLNHKLIITKGEHGVSYSMNNERFIVPSYSVEPIDTTGAGDTFNGALSVALSEGLDLPSAINFANAAAALSIQKFGAQGGMPTRSEVQSFLQ